MEIVKILAKSVKEQTKSSAKDAGTGLDLFSGANGLAKAAFFGAAILAVIVIIIGGINYTMSQGDPGKTKKAKDTILYGVIGLIVALAAFAIVHFVLDNL